MYKGKPVAVLRQDEIVKLSRDEAVVHFAARWDSIRAEVLSWPVSERLRFAADLLDKEPPMTGVALATVRHVLQVMEADDAES
jgi:hypothetical protein